MNGSMVKNHISFKTGFGYNATRRTSFLKWFHVNEFFLRFSSFNFNDTFKTGKALFYIFTSSSSSSPTTATSSESETREREDRSESDTSPVLVSSSNVDDRTGKPVVCCESNHEQGRQANQNFQETNTKETMIERRNPLFADSGRASSDIQEWLQEFRENLVDDRVPEHTDTHASSSLEVSL